jgi:hypothetical protein
MAGRGTVVDIEDLEIVLYTQLYATRHRYMAHYATQRHREEISD